MQSQDLNGFEVIIKKVKRHTENIHKGYLEQQNQGIKWTHSVLILSAGENQNMQANALFQWNITIFQNLSAGKRLWGWLREQHKTLPLSSEASSQCVRHQEHNEKAVMCDGK